MRPQVGWAGVGLALLVAACGPAPTTQATGHLEPRVVTSGLTHRETAVTTAIWRHEVRRQHVRLMAVVSLRVSAGERRASPGGSCPAGPLLRVVLRGAFPGEPASRRYEDLYATSAGRVCEIRYSSAPPRLQGGLADALRRANDVADSG